MLLAVWVCTLPARSEPDSASPPTLTIPRVSRPPTLEDFLEMKPNGEMDGKLARVEGFFQREPNDGQSSSQRTEAYFGYDDKNLYIVFVCFDSEPEKLRARKMQREQIFGDDLVEVMIDTFHDQRRAYAFLANPYGIQLDALWNESATGSNSNEFRKFDTSFDTLWHSRGQLTDRGYVVWMAIPFKSLRFPSAPEQTWGIIFNRTIPRSNENTFWPHISNRIEGRLNQAAVLTGLRDISPGRNIQLIPYVAFRSFRALDTRDPLRPQFIEDDADPDLGLDAKFIFQDSLVLDVTLNPDFNQVESDEPQVTVNERFEVFFPEKRPFFLENANFFDTPISLLFTRRIADPQFGVRLTGKLGPYALAAFLIDDESPGRSVPPGDPLEDKRALFGIVRVNRDLGEQSTLGFIYTDREFEDTFNRVGGVDGRFKLSETWVTSFQAITSSTRCLPLEDRLRVGSGIFGASTDGCFLDDPRSVAGPAYDFALNRSGRSFRYAFEYNDRGRGFRTAPGFLRRGDIRRVGNNIGYLFWPENKQVVNWGPGLFFDRVYDHDGTRLDWDFSPSLQWEFLGQTNLRLFYTAGRVRLRPEDFPGLSESRDFGGPDWGFEFSSSYLPEVTVGGAFVWGKIINFAPPAGQEPFLTDANIAILELTLRPLTPLRIDNTYLFFRLEDREAGDTILNNHILRSRWNWQFTRELSLRAILQYDSTLTNPVFTSLSTRKNFNADFLLTYRVNPYTVLFVGYNGNAQNTFLCQGPGVAGEGCPDLPPDQSALVRPRRRFINDANLFFVKFSYLFRF